MSSTIRVASLQLGLISLEAGILGAVADEDPGLVNLCTHPWDTVSEGRYDGDPPSRIKRKDYCPHCKNDDKATFRKGKVVGDSVVVLSDEDLASMAVDAAAKKTLPLTVHKADELVGTFPTGKSYYLAPRGAGANTYAVLTALITRRSDLAFVTEFSFGGPPALYQVLVQGDVLVLRQLARPSSVKAAPQIEGEANEALLPVAEQLAQALCTPFDPDQYRDKRAAALAELLERVTPVALATGGEGSAPAAPGGDLMATLQAALAAAAPAPAKTTRKRTTKKAAA